jgi:hypothetical protein
MPSSISSADLALYLDILEKVAIVWMEHGNRDVGLAPVPPPGKEYVILLWPYEYESVREMATVVTHEVVHWLNPELPEGAVKARTQALMQNVAWNLLVYQFVAESLLAAVHWLRKNRGASLA